jgi:hypothetical protein
MLTFDETLIRAQINSLHYKSTEYFNTFLPLTVIKQQQKAK